jgi:hypothetical protein
MRKILIIILAILMVSPGAIWAQSQPGNPPTPAVSKAKKKLKNTAQPKAKFTPIDVEEHSFEYYDADSGWSVATATSYSYKGSNLSDPKDFERVIYPLNDPEANNFLRSAADKDGWGQGLLWGGIAVETAGWTDFTVEMLGMESTDSSGHVTEHTPNVLPSIVMVLGGVGFILKGVFTQMDAGTDRANAVERYNSVVQSDNNLSMMVLPGTQAVGLSLTQTF